MNKTNYIRLEGIRPAVAGEIESIKLLVKKFSEKYYRKGGDPVPVRWSSIPRLSPAQNNKARSFCDGVP